MKIKPEHLAQLEALMRVGLVRVPSQAAYVARDPSIPRIALSTDTAKRHRWDALYAAGASEWTTDVYRYANDSHIDTALKAVVAKLNQG